MATGVSRFCRVLFTIVLAVASPVSRAHGDQEHRANAGEPRTRVAKWLLAVILLVVAGIGATGAWLTKHRGGGCCLACAEAFAGGALASAGLLHLLPDATKELEEALGGDENDGEIFPWAQLLCGLGCLVTHGSETVAACLWTGHVAPRGVPVHGSSTEAASALPAQPITGRQRRGGSKPSPTRLGTSDVDVDEDDGGVFSQDCGQQEQENAPVLETSDMLGLTEHGSNGRPREFGNGFSLASGSLLMVALSIHSILEGLSLGAANQSRALDLFLAILAHKGVAAFSLGVAWLGGSCSRNRYMGVMTWFALTTPLGIAFGTPVEGSRIGAVATGLSSGTFIYVGLVETCPGVRADWFPTVTGATVQTLSYLSGFVAMACLAVYA